MTEERPVELKCGRCGTVIYTATQSTYEKSSVLAAVDAHELKCPPRHSPENQLITQEDYDDQKKRITSG